MLKVSKVSKLLVMAAVAGMTITAFDGAALARGAGGGAGGGGGGGSGAGGGGGNNPASLAQPNTVPGHPRRHLGHDVRQYSASCPKQDPIYDNQGRLVARWHGVDCAE